MSARARDSDTPRRRSRGRARSRPLLRWFERPVALATLVAVLLGMPSGTGTAQGAPGRDSTPAPRLTVRGAVYDSLAFEPLGDAFVVARPSGSSTTTDSLGGFTLLSDGPVSELLVYHPALDRMGLGAIGAVRGERDRDGDWRDVRIATPSLATLWPQLCESRRPLGVRSVILTGTARLADNQTRVSGAKVIVQWQPVVPTGRESPYESLEVLTDSIGNYVACGVEEFTEPSVLALSAEAQSGVISLPSEVRPHSPGGPHPRARTGEAMAGAAIRGRVVNEDGLPVRDVRVSIDGRNGSVTTAANGTFTIDSVPYGSRMLNVRAIGFSPVGQVVEVVEGDNPPLTIPVRRVVELEGVRVTERAVLRRDRSEYELRRRAGIGRFVDSTAIMRAPNVRAAIQMVPNVRVAARDRRATTEFEIRGRNGCLAQVYLDGVRSDTEEVNRIPPANIASIEFYSAVSLAPARFIAVAADDCAVVLFWTKVGLRP